MASGSFSVGTSNSHIVGQINWSESNQNSSNDTSVVYAEMRLWRNNTGYTSSGSDNFWVSINGTTINSGTEAYSLTYNSNTLMVSGSVTVTHNNDGTKSITIGWGGGGSSSGVFTVSSSSGTATLDTLPRASTVASNVSWTAGTQDLSISLNVANSSFHHSIQLWVLEINGSTWDWVGQRDNIGSSTTWQFTVAEVTQIYSTNSMYENRPILVRVYTYDQYGNQIGGYQDTQGTVYAVATSTMTFANFNIGDSIPASITNYIGGTFTYDAIMTIGSWSKTWTNIGSGGANPTLTFVQADIDSMYAQTPNANTVSGSITLRTKYNGVYTEDGVPTGDTNNFSCYVTNSSPTFGTGYTYADTNSTVTGITLNNQYIVQNQSKLTVTLPKANAAAAIHAATLSYYNFTAATASATMYVPTAAPTLSTTSTGGLLAAGTYYVMYTWVNSAGESYSSPETSIVVPTGTTTNKITVTIPSFPTGVTSANIYISTATGTETKQGNTTSTTYNQTAALVSGAALPAMTINLGTINAASNTNLQVKAVDSRGNYTTTSINVNIVPYSAPTVTAAATRNNGFDVTTVLTLSGTASAVAIGGVNKNSIVSAQYQTRQKGGTFGSLSNFTISGFPNYSATNVTLTLDNTLAWDINFVVTDKFGNTSVIQSVTAGTPIMAIDSNLKSVGIGQFPTHANAFEMMGDIFVSGNRTADATTTLVNGSNALTVTQNTPVSIQSIKGRTLINLLGSTGSFEVSLAPYNWTNWYAAGSANIAVDSSTCTTGNYSLKITSTASGFGEAYNGFQSLIDPTKYYVIVGDAKNYNASGGVGVGFYNIGNASQAVTVSTTTSTSWTPVFVRIQPSQLTGTTNFQVYGGYVSANASGQYGWVDGVRFYEITQAEYNAIGSMTAAQVAAKYPYVDNAQGVINPTIDYNGNRMVVQTTLHSNKDQSVYDELFIDTDGKLKKRQWFKEVYLNPSENWNFGADYSGYKEINCTVNSSNNADDYFGNPSYSILVRPDGYILKKNSPASSAMNQYDFNTTTLNTIYIDIPDYYTGWGETYTPYKGEVNTFMYGWKEYDGGAHGDGTGTYSGSNRNWCRMNLYTGTYVDGNSIQPTALAPTNSLFRLIYQLPSAQIVNIDPTGLILLPTGSNTVTLKQGIVVRERMNPVVNPSDSGNLYVNTLNTYSGLYAGMFKYPCKTILKIEKNSIDDTANWAIGLWSTSTTDIYGQQRAVIPQRLFDPTADYFVTYEIQYGGSMIADQMGISYPQSFRGLFDYTLSTLVNHENKLDSLDSMYAKRISEPWMTLSLLNGWTSYDQTGGSNWTKPAFYKDNMGVVHLKGLIALGTMNANCATLPSGYRPKERLILTCVTGDNSVQRLDIEPNGNVTPVAGNNGFVSLDGVSFRAGVNW